MNVGLMAYIPNQLITIYIKNVMQSNGQFYHTQVTAKVPARFQYILYEESSQFFTQLWQLTFI